MERTEIIEAKEGILCFWTTMISAISMRNPTLALVEYKLRQLVTWYWDRCPGKSGSRIDDRVKTLKSWGAKCVLGDQGTRRWSVNIFFYLLLIIIITTDCIFRNNRYLRISFCPTIKFLWYSPRLHRLKEQYLSQHGNEGEKLILSPLWVRKWK